MGCEKMFRLIEIYYLVHKTRFAIIKLLATIGWSLVLFLKVISRKLSCAYCPVLCSET